MDFKGLENRRRNSAKGNNKVLIQEMIKSISAYFSEKLTKPFLLFCLMLIAFCLKAQTYPVQVMPVLIPPYTLQTSSYYNGASERLAVVLTNTDLQKPVLSVRLRMYIEGQNAKLQSRDGVYYPTINLDAGVPTRIALSDLAPYFNADNLNFQGITRAQYIQNGKLPEGFYQFCFEAVEVTTGKVVSRKSCSMAWISLSDPPLLNLPRKGESIASREVQNIVFQWTPRSLGSPNSAFNTEYEFTLAELWDTGIAPEAAFGTVQPLYQTTVKTTTLLLGPSEPQLIPGKRYAWRVRAVSTSPAGDPTDSYRNNGYSEIYWFTYQSNCRPPVGINASITGGRATITWSPDAAGGVPEGGYTLQYRERSQSSSQWYSYSTINPRIMLYDLKPGLTYEYRVGSSCSTGFTGDLDGATYSDLLTLVMSGNVGDTTTTNCGMIAPEIAIANRTPITTLGIGDLFTAGKFPVKITEIISGGNGSSVTGKGYVTIPMLGQMNVKVSFTGIGINSDRQLYNGVVETTYDVKEGQIGDIDDIIEGGNGTGIVRTGADAADHNVDFPIRSIDDIKVELKDADGNTVPAGGSGTTQAVIKVNGPNGKTETINADKLPTTIKDSEGNIYKVDEKGKVTKISENVPLNMTPAQLNTLAADKGVVNFIDYPEKQVYAFDAYKELYGKSSLFGKEYENLNGYYVNAKAIIPGKTDVVKATILLKDNQLKADSVQFITGKGAKLSKNHLTGNDYEITTVGGPANDAQEIYAVYPQGNGKYLSLGKLLLASYKAENYKINLVPVNGATANENEIATKLNRIYNPIGVSFTVSKAADFADKSWDLNNDGKLAVSGSGLLSTQTAEMKALNNAYKAANPALAKDIATLFVLGTSDSTSSLKGDMPRNKQFGYLFNGADGSVAAHEIGHGLFSLKHTFDGFGFVKGEMASNLMDYPNGEKLTKFQWDIVHAPGVVVGLFEKDADAQDIVVSNLKEIYKKYGQDGKLTFLSPSGQPITIKEEIVELSFSSFEDQWYQDKFNQNSYLPIGALQSFTLKDGRKFTAARIVNSTGTSVKIAGYCTTFGTSSSECKDSYLDTESKKQLNNKIVLGFLGIDKSYPVFKIYGADKNKFVFADIPAQNSAAGTQVSLFYAANFIEGEALNIASNIQPLNLKELLFINQFGNQDVQGISALYLLRMAYFLKNMPQLNDCMGLAGQSTANSLNSSYNQKIISGLNSNSGNTGVNVKIPFFKVADITAVMSTPKYLPELHNLLEKMFFTLKNNSATINSLEDKDIDDVVDLLAINDKVGRECLLTTLPINIRMQIIRKHTQWTTSNSKEVFVSDLMDYINYEDAPKLLDSLAANNYSLYWSLYNDQYFQSDKDRLAGIISNLIINLKKGEINSLNKSITASSDKYIYLCKENVIDAVVVPICKVMSAQDGNDISVKIFDISNTFSNESVSDSYKGAPFDLVKVVFTSNFQFKMMDGKKIEKGDSTVVPLIWLDWLINKQENTTNWTLVRIGADAVAVVAAVATVNPEIVVIVDAGMAATDIVVQLSSDKLRSTYASNSTAIAFLDGWDQLYGVYGGVRLGQIVFNPSNWVKTMDGLRTAGKNLRGTADLFYNVYKLVKNSNGSVKIIIDAQRDVFGNLLRKIAIETELAEHCTRADEIFMTIQGRKFLVGVKATLRNTSSAIADFELAENAANVSGMVLSNLNRLPANLTSTRVLETIKAVKCIGYAEPITFDVVLASDGNYYAANVVENNQNIDNLIAKLTGDDAKYITVLNSDLRSSNTLLSALTNKPALLNEWLLLEKAGSKVVKLDVSYLEKFDKLQAKVQEMVALFSDTKQASTLTKFLDDCDDVAFRSFINEGENIDYVKSFLEYKNGIDVSAERASVINDEIREITDIAVREKAIKWYDRSLLIQGNLSKFKKANAFGDANSVKIASNSNPPCNAWGGNAGKVVHKQLDLKAVNGKHVVLDDGIVDLTPVAYTGPNNNIPIYKLIYHDSKLTDAAAWTKNQTTEIIEALKNKSAPNDFVEFEVRTVNDKLPPNSPLVTTSKVRIYRADVYKSISNGDGLSIIQTKKIF